MFFATKYHYLGPISFFIFWQNLWQQEKKKGRASLLFIGEKWPKAVTGNLIRNCHV
jgi:hypothetical protein